MFVDYLTVTYDLPHDWQKNPTEHDRTALHLYRRHRAGERDHLQKEYGFTTFKVQEYPDKILLVVQIGGSLMPLDLDDWYRNYCGPWAAWRVSRLDLAENLPTVLPHQIYTGRSRFRQDYSELHEIGDGQEPVKTWTGCTVGRRGTNNVYMRVYDCLAHVAGREAKIVRHGSCDFWRLEYEFPRAYLRRLPQELLHDFTPDVLERLYEAARSSKGVTYDETWQSCQRLTMPPQDRKSNYAHQRRQRLVFGCFKKMSESWRRRTLVKLCESDFRVDEWQTAPDLAELPDRFPEICGTRPEDMSKEIECTLYAIADLIERHDIGERSYYNIKLEKIYHEVKKMLDPRVKNSDTPF